MFLVDMEQGRIIDDEEMKQQIATRSPTASGCATTSCRWRTCPAGPAVHDPDHETVLQRQQAFGYTTRRPAKS